LLTPDDVQGFMHARAVAGELLLLDVPTPTVEMAAQAVSALPQQIIKSLLFLVNDQPVLAITCGTATIDRRAIAALYGVGRKKVRLASPDEVLSIAGYPVGAMPPFAHLQLIPTLVDRSVLQQPFVYGGGGGECALLRLTPDELLRLTGAQVLDLTSPEAS
jgi:prolyl-tRNA editing enzyme YbaK/EbsC (Cys-tRNA(Pro) deacylase)